MSSDKKTALPKPGVEQFSSPIWIARWIGDLFMSWFGTRDYRMLLYGFPFAALMVFLLLLPRVTRPRPTQYREAYNKANTDENEELAELTLRRLVVDNPDDVDFRFRLAKRYVDAGNYESGIQILRQLAPTSSIGHVPAHAELLKLALDPKSGFKMEERTMLRRLTALNTHNPKDDIIAAMLGRHYVRMKLPLLAEPFLKQAAKDSAEDLFELAQLQRSIGKREDSIKTARRAAAIAGDFVTKNPETQQRLLWARILVWLNDIPQAERVLVEGERLAPERFGEPLAALYMSAATSDARRSKVTRDNVTDLLEKALKLDPNNELAVNYLLQSVERGASVDPAVKTRLRQHWDKKSQSGEPHILAISAAIENLCGDSQSAIAKLRTAADKDPSYKGFLLDMYHRTGKLDEFKANADEVLRQHQVRLAEEPGDSETRLKLAKLYLLLEQYDESIQTLADRHERFPEEGLGRTLGVAYQNVAKNQTGEARLETLEKSLQASPRDPRTLAAIARFAVGKDLAQRTKKMLARFVAEGRVPAFKVLSAVGTAHLDDENHKLAAEQLERARRLKPDDPFVLNNLALALVRADIDKELFALQLINQAIKVVPGEPPQFLSTRGEVFLSMERWGDAARDLAAAAKHEKTARLYNRLATAYENLGEQELAAAHREKATALDELGGL